MFLYEKNVGSFCGDRAFASWQLMRMRTGKSRRTGRDTWTTMEISFITIGKGDAFLLKMPEGSYYMYDTGKKEDFEQIQKVLEQKKVTSLKGIFLSHGHKDHAGNLKNLLEEYPVETVYISEKDQASYGKIDVEKITKDFDTTIVLLQGGETLSLEGAEAKVWIPKTCDFRNANNNSVIIRFSYGKNSCLMTGDMEYGEEAAYLRSGEACKTDILKLGHHGESDATSVAFLEKVKPGYGWITGSEEENPDSVNEEIAARLEAFETEAFSSGRWPSVLLPLPKVISLNHRQCGIRGCHDYYKKTWRSRTSAFVSDTWKQYGFGWHSERREKLYENQSCKSKKYLVGFL